MMMADDTFYGFRVVTNPAIPEGVIYTRTGVIETLAQEVERLRAENAAMRPIVADIAQEPRLDVPMVAQKSGVEMCALCHRIEGDDGSIDHAPDCPAVLAARVMGQLST